MSTVEWGGNSQKFGHPADADPSTLAAPASKIVQLPTDGTTFTAPRKIIGDKAGSATVVDCIGETVTGFPITGGEQHVSITAASALSTTTKLFGLY